MADDTPTPNIPTLTEVITHAVPPLAARDALVAELQTKLAARAFVLAEGLMRSAFAEMEASLLERISANLRRELPEIIDATLREHLSAEEHN